MKLDMLGRCDSRCSHSRPPVGSPQIRAAKPCQQHHRLQHCQARAKKAADAQTLEQQAEPVNPQAYPEDRREEVWVTRELDEEEARASLCCCCLSVAVPPGWRTRPLVTVCARTQMQ